MQDQQLNKRHQRRAVAPIIGTLLMVTVTVVGGILVLVFSQGFFSDMVIAFGVAIAILVVGCSTAEEGLKFWDSANMKLGEIIP